MWQMLAQFDWLLAIQTYLWQGSAIAALAWSFTKFWPGLNATTRYGVWSVALVAMFMLPLAWVIPVGQKVEAEKETTAKPKHVQTILLKATTLQEFDTVSTWLPKSEAFPLAPASMQPLPQTGHKVIEFKTVLPPQATVTQKTVSKSVEKPSPSTTAWWQEGQNWQNVLAAVWLIGLAFFGLRIAIDLVKLRLLKSRVRAMRGPLAQWFVDKATAMEISRPVTLAGSHAVTSPMAIGFLRPYVLIPEYLWVHLDGDALKQVLSHELAHIRRGDDWHHLYQRLMMAALFWHPAAWFVFKCLTFERELACDDWAVRDGKAHKYARSLVRVYERLGHLPVNAGALGAAKFRSQLGRRVEHLTDNQHQRGVQVSTFPLLLSIFALFGSAALLAWQSPGPKVNLNMGMFSPLFSVSTDQGEEEIDTEQARNKIRETSRLLAEHREEMRQLAREKDQINRELAQRTAELAQRRAELTQREAELQQRTNEAKLRTIERELAADERQQREAMLELRTKQVEQVRAQSEAMIAQQTETREQSEVQRQQMQEENARKLEQLEQKLEHKRRELEEYQEQLEKAREKLHKVNKQGHHRMRIEKRGDGEEIEYWVVGQDGEEILVTQDFDFNYDYSIEDNGAMRFVLRTPPKPDSPNAPPEVVVVNAADLQSISTILPDVLDEVDLEDLQGHIARALEEPHAALELAEVDLAEISDGVIRLNSGEHSIHRIEINDNFIFANGKGNNTIITIEDDDTLFTMAGQVTLNDDGTAIESMGDKAKLILQIEEDGRQKRVEIEKRNGQLDQEYTVDRRSVPFDPEGRNFLERHLPKLALYNRNFLNKRINTLLNQGGTDAVFALIEEHDLPSHLQSLILKQLMEEVELNAADIDHAINLAMKWESSHDRSVFYKSVMNFLPTASLEQWAANMFRGLSSYEKGQLTRHIVASHDQLTPNLIKVMLLEIQQIDSDHDRTRSLINLAMHVGSYETLHQAGFADATAAIDSNYETARLWKKVVREYGSAVSADLARVVDGMDSSHEIAGLLKTYLRTIDAPLAPVWTGVNRIDSSYNKAEVLSMVARNYRLSNTDQIAFLEAVQKVQSSHERNNVLKIFKRYNDPTGKAQDLYIQLLETVSHSR